ncbi:MAG TPA: sodium:proton antiporter [Edaphobacter sp.]|nr:sodium:proton antiporter [Edaphobacter sp.]
MSVFALISVVVTFAAIFALVSFRWLRLPTTIGTMALSLVSTTILSLLGRKIPGLQQLAADILSRLDFNAIVLHGMLAFLLFAGALHLDLAQLKRQRLPVLILSTFGTLLSAAFVAGLLWLVLIACQMRISFLNCLIFGALISPTDPVAVLEMLRRVGCPPHIQALLGGESLFNDGVGAVLFLALIGSSGSNAISSVSSFSVLFLLAAGGGIALGLALGYITYRLLLLIDSYSVEILLTLALAMGGYALADALHISAPLEAVAAGIVVNSRGRRREMPAVTHEDVDKFWHLLDDILNVVLFLLLGFSLVLVPFSARLMVAGLLAVPVVLLARGASVALLLYPIQRPQSQFASTWAILTWGGLRGALSVALVLVLVRQPGSGPLLPITYTVVVFSVLVQGLTMVPLLRRLGLAAPDSTSF